MTIVPRIFYVQHYTYQWAPMERVPQNWPEWLSANQGLIVFGTVAAILSLAAFVGAIAMVVEFFKKPAPLPTHYYDREDMMDRAERVRDAKPKRLKR